MEKEISYLTERKFDEGRESTENDEKILYWKKVLGKNSYFFLSENSRQFKGYINDEKYFVDELDISETLLNYLLYQEIEKNFEKCFEIESDVVFSHFYYKILNYSFINLKKKLNGFEKYFDSSVYRDFILHLVMQLQTICTRTLIEQMHSYKNTNKLSGETPQEEYHFFNEMYAGKSEFYNELFEQYPVLYRCIIEKVNQLEEFYIEIIKNFKKDKELLQRELFVDKTIKKIKQIKSESSDLHNGGKQVVKVKIDNEFEILYKPRSMENEKIYYKILSDLGEKLGVEQYGYRFVTKRDHSWSCIVKYKTCNSDEQIRRYYLRLGIQLFLTYMLGTKDLHYENLIACGEYPVFVDLEVLANPLIDYERETAKEEIYHQIFQSVLGSGILPYHLGSKARIDASAISGMEGQICPFKVPVIVDAKTSNMRIEYRYPMSTRAKNLATLNEKFYEPYVYKRDIISGFSMAYSHVMKNAKEIKEIINPLKDMKSRFLATDTQRYSMVLSSSYHPSLLKDGADREVFLNVMWNGRKLNDEDIVNIEIENMLNGDIPYFYSLGTMLYCGKKLISTTYFNKTSVQGIYEKIGMLDEDNLVKQIEYIEVSLDLMSNKKKNYFNKVYHVSEKVIRNIEEDTI